MKSCEKVVKVLFNGMWEFSEWMDKGLWKEKEELIDEGDGDHERMQYTRRNKYKSKLGKEEKYEMRRRGATLALPVVDCPKVEGRRLDT